MSIAAKSAIHAVYDASTLSDGEYDYFHSIATSKRQQRSKAFLRREDACRSLVGEALVRLQIRLRVGKELNDAMIVENQHGKPAIIGDPFSYNISHSGDWVVCAVDRYDIGIDVERKHKVDFGIADRFFTPAEQRFVSGATSENEKADRFFTLWSLKESYIKAIGRGLSCPLDKFECLPDADGNVSLHLLDEQLPLRYLQITDLRDDKYACAVCSHDPSFGVNPHLCSPGELKEALSLPAPFPAR